MNTIVTLTPAAVPDGDALKAVASPPAAASMVEIRLDLFPEADPTRLVRACPLPTLLTLRSTAEGGAGPNDPSARRAILMRARESGAAMIDLEHARDAALLSELGLPPEQVVLSWHDRDGTPRDLKERAVAMASFPARFIKLVPTVESLDDLSHVLEVLRAANPRPPGSRRCVVFGMGVAGVASRYLGVVWGPPVMFCAWSTESEAAPGQLTCDQLIQAVSHLEGPPRALDVVLGTDVSRSLSPALHGAAHRSSGRWEALVPLSVIDRDEAEALLRGRRPSPFRPLGLEIRGWAVTTPYKSLAARVADVRAPRVERAGAANTLFRRGGRLIAENTDADGVVGGLTSIGIEVDGMSALIAGTGGAARGAAVGLDQAGADVSLRGRDVDATQVLAEGLGVASCDPEDRAGAEILVNATPLGGRPDDPLPFTENEILMASAVVDMVYGPRPTELENRCADAGVPFVSGRRMLAHQGMAQFSAFTQTPPPRRAMLAAVGISESPRRPGPLPSTER
jgi:3-dehydroquinate dehydratase/shikimate dehydrogenase